MQRGQKCINDFKFGTLYSHFPSNGAANMTVKGLMSLANKYPCILVLYNGRKIFVLFLLVHAQFVSILITVWNAIEPQETTFSSFLLLLSLSNFRVTLQNF